MKYQNIVVYLVISLAFLYISSLLETVHAQTNSTNQQPPQQNQNMNITAQALMKVNIFELKDNLMEANLAIVDGNLKDALTGMRDVESQLLQVEPMPTKFLNYIHKAITSIARSDIEKALDTLTTVQVTLLKAENQIFKAAVANPQVMQQIHTVNYVLPTPQSQEIQQVDTSKNVEPTPQPEKIQQVNTLENLIPTP